jgi:3-hydroxyanthranilate 3,4-dioxygenase
MNEATLIPIDFMQWINENRHLLKPPIGNKVIWKNGEFICMVVGGPNRRTDYHYDEGPEFFYQLEGNMVLKVMEGEGPRDIKIKQGEILLLPPRVPHSPQRFPNTVGLVIERQRMPGEQDGLIWYCEKCSHLLYEEYFELQDIESQFTPVFQRFYSDPSKRTCSNCGHLNPAPE